jgi:hypothetical protein
VLTTADSQSMSANVVTDVNANTFSDKPAPRAMLSPEAALLFNKSIVARPLMVPEVCSLRIKNTEYRYRWVNNGGRNGSIYMQRRAQGFTNATTDDAEVLVGDAVSDKGSITAGDVILMKIRADLYDAAIKWNMEKANVLARTRGMYLKGASSDVHSDTPVVRESISHEAMAQTGKTSAFIPDNPDAIIAGQSEMNLAAARKTVSEIRENIKANPTKGAAKE